MNEVELDTYGPCMALASDGGLHIAHRRRQDLMSPLRLLTPLALEIAGVEHRAYPPQPPAPCSIPLARIFPPHL
jgi:hypothetical protein